MATIIQIKRSNAASAPSTLKQGEMGLTFGTGTQAVSYTHLTLPTKA